MHKSKVLKTIACFLAMNAVLACSSDISSITSMTHPEYSILTIETPDYKCGVEATDEAVVIEQLASAGDSDLIGNSVISTVLGTGGRGYKDGSSNTALLALPYSITLDANDDLLIFDTYNKTIRYVLADTASTLISNAGKPVDGVYNSRGELFYIDSENSVIRQVKNGVANTFGDTSLLDTPMAIAIDKNDNIYVADTLNDCVRKITPSGSVTTVASGFNAPAGIAVSGDGDIVYVADTGNHEIKKIENGQVTTIADTVFLFPRGIAISGDSILVADSGNHVVREITGAGQVITIAGSGFPGDNETDVLNSPSGVYYRNGLLYIADTANNKIKQMFFMPGQMEETNPLTSATSRSVSILSVEGAHVFMTRGTDKEISAGAGMVLFDGYTVTTGNNSKCVLLLDDGSLLTIDQNSKISISRTWRSRFSVSVLRGGLLVDAASQKPDETVEVWVGNSAISILGTMFIAEHIRTGDVAFTMFEGSGDAGGIILQNGYAVDVFDTATVKRRHELRRISFDENTSLFVLRSVLANVERFILNGTISREDVPMLENLEREKQSLTDHELVVGFVESTTNRQQLKAYLQFIYVSVLPNVVVSSDGKDVAPNREWVSQEVMDEFKPAVVRAQVFLDLTGTTEPEAKVEVTTLDAATIKLLSAAQRGALPLPDKYFDTTKLLLAIGNAAREINSVFVSIDGEDVRIGDYWVSPVEFLMLSIAISKANYVYNNTRSSEDVVNAVSELDLAVSEFIRAKKPGTVPLDFTDLLSAMYYAESELARTRTGGDLLIGTSRQDFFREQLWVRQEIVNELEQALKHAHNTIASADTGQPDIRAALHTLNLTTEWFVGSILHGSKQQSDSEVWLSTESGKKYLSLSDAADNAAISGGGVILTADAEIDCMQWSGATGLDITINNGVTLTITNRGWLIATADNFTNNGTLIIRGYFDLDSGAHFINNGKVIIEIGGEFTYLKGSVVTDNGEWFDNNQAVPPPEPPLKLNLAALNSAILDAQTLDDYLFNLLSSDWSFGYDDLDMAFNDLFKEIQIAIKYRNSSAALAQQDIDVVADKLRNVIAETIQLFASYGIIL